MSKETLRRQISCVVFLALAAFGIFCILHSNTTNTTSYGISLLAASIVMLGICFVDSLTEALYIYIHRKL